MSKKRSGHNRFKGAHQNPMKEIIKINNMLNKINVGANVDSAINKVNEMNNKILENNSVQIATQILENKTVIKNFKDDSFRIPTYVETDSVQVVNKPFVIGYLKDYGGCGHFRMVYPMNLINSRFSFDGKINCTLFPRMLVQDDLIPHVRAFVFQRPMGEESTYAINAYKKFQPQYQYKLIAELDDYIFEVPNYHPMYKTNTVEKTRSLLVNLANMDEIIVSTETLKNSLVELGLTNRITVIENYLPKHLYQTDTKRFRFLDIQKPTIAYTGANYHYNNEQQMCGDFTDNVQKFIKKNIDNYNFIFYGSAPYFLKEEADAGKLVIVPFTNPVEYTTNLKKYRADFVIAPLVENIFNACKSDLRYLESSAMGSVFIGSRFTGKLSSPYQNLSLTFTEETTVEELENIISKHCNKDEFNKILSEQYDFLDSRWLENNNNIFKYVETYSSGIGGVKVSESHPQYIKIQEIVNK